MFIRILLVAAAVVVVLGLVIATRPAAFRIQRSIMIAAPASLVFAHLDDFRRWSAWSPYDKLDPSAAKTYSGATSGIGASFHYRGRKTGEGRMTITDARLNELVAIRADFIRPFAATNQIEFTLNPAANGVTLTWAMTGRNGFAFKAFGLIVNVDKMVGKEFEAGLADLKRVSEHDAVSLASIN